MKDWIIEHGSSGGTIRHEAPPRFAARWTSGDDPDELAGIEGPCWSEQGSGSGDDDIHIYGFEWPGPAPKPDEFQALMQQAATAIDEWIASKL